MSAPTALMNQPPVSSPQAAAIVRNAFIAMGASGPRTLVSVYPLEQQLELRHEGTKTYRMPSAPEGSYSTLTVEDTFASVKNFMSGQMYPAPVPAAVVADNLIIAWTRGRVGTDHGLGPGILICRGSAPELDEIASANARQLEYFRYLVNDADLKFTKEGMLNISDDHRMAAKWMGIQDRKWAQPLVQSDAPDKCPACKEEIKAGALLCKHCGSDIEKFIAGRVSISATPTERKGK